MKIIIRQVRELVREIDYNNYLPEDRNADRIMEIEKEAAEELIEYMEDPETTETITVSLVGTCKQV